MEALPDAAPSGPRWISRLVEVLQPLSVRADRLGSIALFAGLPWADLEFAAAWLGEGLIERGTRMTVQGQPSSRMWLITQGEALVSTDARPVRVAGRGDVVGGATLLFRLKSAETTFALTPIRAFEAGPQQFRELIKHPQIRERLTVSLLPADARLVRPARRRVGSGPLLHPRPASDDVRPIRAPQRHSRTRSRSGSPSSKESQ